MSNQLINRKTLHQMIPLSERTIYDMEKRNEFPARIALSSRRVAWSLSEVENWIASRLNAKAARPGDKVA